MAETPGVIAWIADLLRLPGEVDGIKTELTEVRMIMARYEEEIAALNEATNEVAAKVEELRGIINSDDPAVETALNEISARLKGLAADPEAPVPPVEPTPEPTPEG